MAELEHYGMKERSASAKDAEEARIGEAAPPAKAADEATAAEAAEPAKETSSNKTDNRAASANSLRKVSLAEAFGPEESSYSEATKSDENEDTPTRDPFEPAPPSPDSIVTNVMAATGSDQSNEGVDPFAPSTSTESAQTFGASASTQTPNQTYSSTYTPSYEVTSAAYAQSVYEQTMSQGYGQGGAYSNYGYDAASQDPYGTYGAMPPRKNNKAIAALVCGILSMVLCWTTIPGIILGIVAIVLAGSAADLWGKTGKTTAAKVTGVLGLVTSTLVLAFMLLSFALFTLADDLPYSVNSNSSSTSEESSFLDLLPLDEFGSIVTGKDSPNAPLSGQERAAAEAAMDALKQIPKNTALLTSLGTNADDYFADMNGGIRLKDIGLSGADVVRWLVDNMQCSVANDGVFITDDSSAMVFVDASAPTMWTYTDAATQSFEQKYGEAEMDTEKEYLDALGDAYKTASTTAEVETKYLSLNLTNRNGTWVVDSDSLLQQAQYLFDLWS